MSDILLVIIALILLSGILRRIIFYSIRKSFQKAAEDFNKSNSGFNSDIKNQKAFWSNKNTKKNINNSAGDYVDYEEIK